MSEKEWIDGLTVKAPHERAPDFVKMTMSFNVKKLGNWLREKSKAGEEWVNIDVKEAKGGNWYAEVSQYKSKAESSPKEHNTPGDPDFDDGKIPF